MRVKATKIIGVVFAILLIAAAGVVILLKQGALAPPELVSFKNQWGKVTQQETEILTTAVIENPNPVSIPIKAIEVNVYMNGIKLAYGGASDISLPAKERSKIEIKTVIQNKNLPEWWYTHIKNGEKSTVLIEGKAHVSLLGKDITFPFKAEREIKTELLRKIEVQGAGSELPGAPRVERVDNTWGKATPDTTEIISRVTIYNPNPFPLPVSRVRYTMMMNGILMASGESSPVVLPPEAEETIVVVSTLDNRKIPQWWVTHIKNGEKTTLEMKGELVYKFAGRELVIELPGYSTTFTTNMLGG